MQHDLRRRQMSKVRLKDSTESFKGKIVVLNPEKSEIANKINLKSKGNFAIKTR